MCLDLSLFFALAAHTPACQGVSFILFSQRQVAAAEAQSDQSVFLSSLALTSNLIRPLVSECQRSLCRLFCPFFSDNTFIALHSVLGKFLLVFLFSDFTCSLHGSSHVLARLGSLGSFATVQLQATLSSYLMRAWSAWRISVSYSAFPSDTNVPSA